MALEMKSNCMNCDGGLDDMGVAWICSYECTFCTPCTKGMEHTCPNCGGELVRRPMRQPKD